MPTTTPLILAHRGDSAHAPENTLASFDLALAAGADGVEFDVHQAHDDAFVVHHDPDTPAGAIAALDLADLRGRPAKRGGAIPSLQEALALLAAGGPAFTVFVEVKGMRSWPDLRRELSPWRGRLDLEVQSFEHDLLAAMARDGDGWPLGVIAREPGPDPAALLARFGAHPVAAQGGRHRGRRRGGPRRGRAPGRLDAQRRRGGPRCGPGRRRPADRGRSPVAALHVQPRETNMTHRIRTRFASPVVLALALAATTAARAESPIPGAAGHWEGAIVLPGQELGIKIDLAADGGTWSGTIDIPMQGATGLPLENVRAAGDSLVFAIAKIPGAPTFHGLFADGRLSGDFTQNGMTFPFRLGREATAAPERPQEPQPPFPYRSEEVTYRNGDIVLAGTLTLPEGPGPFPAAVLLTGSGAQNRDEELFAHKPFLVLADHLTRAGVAVLRADDRGVGGSTGSVSLATTADFADDALAGVALLRARPDIAGGCVGLIGHSEGGIAAPLAAANAPEAVDFVVLLAGTGVPLGEVILRQAELIMKAGGTDSLQIADELAQTRLVLGLVAAGADSATIRAELERHVVARQAAHPDRAKAGRAEGHAGCRRGRRGHALVPLRDGARSPRGAARVALPGAGAQRRARSAGGPRPEPHRDRARAARGRQPGPDDPAAAGPQPPAADGGDGPSERVRSDHRDDEPHRPGCGPRLDPGAVPRPLRGVPCPCARERRSCRDGSGAGPGGWRPPGWPAPSWSCSRCASCRRPCRA
ncbi:MAG: alpha/beta hydrolase [bacterium]|nr:alpha/beta hydrolase [bacterium]